MRKAGVRETGNPNKDPDKTRHKHLGKKERP